MGMEDKKVRDESDWKDRGRGRDGCCGGGGEGGDASPVFPPGGQL